MKDLPYFRWWVARAETDEAYQMMNDTERGFYHRCMNKSWINAGLPENLDDLAALMGNTREYVDAVWARVSKKWYSENGRLYNKTQEEERAYATNLSEKNRRAGNTNARKTRVSSVENAGVHHGKRECSTQKTRVSDVENASVPLRAYDSVSDSVSGSLDFDTEEPKMSTTDRAMAVFSDVWESWPRKTGKDSACQDWLSQVHSSNLDKVLSCVQRYLRSDEVARGAVRNLGSTTQKPGWLVDCARDGWACDWPAAKLPKGVSVVESAPLCGCGAPAVQRGLCEKHMAEFNAEAEAEVHDWSAIWRAK